MDLGLEGKVAIVTGGAAGIGKASVQVLAEEGAHVIVIDRDKAALEELDSSWFRGRGCLFLPYDLLEDAECKKVVEITTKEYGRIDILVNNAGGNDFKHIDKTSPSEFRKSLDLNLVMPYAMTHYAWPHLKKTRGNVVFVGSKVSIVGEGNPPTAAYAAAKGGVNGLTRELATISAREDLGIRVNCILPGKVDTYIERIYPGREEEGRRIEGSAVPFGRRMTNPREIAYAIAFLASDKISGHTTGQLYSPDGGYIHLDRNV